MTYARGHAAGETAGGTAMHKELKPTLAEIHAREAASAEILINFNDNCGNSEKTPDTLTRPFRRMIGF
jgi:hypothetical protein